MAALLRLLLLLAIIAVVMILISSKLEKHKKVKRFIKTLPHECFLLVRDKNTKKYVNGYYLYNSYIYISQVDGNYIVFRGANINPLKLELPKSTETKYLPVEWVADDLVDVKLLSEVTVNQAVNDENTGKTKKQKGHR